MPVLPLVCLDLLWLRSRQLAPAVVVTAPTAGLAVLFTLASATQ